MQPEKISIKVGEMADRYIKRNHLDRSLTADDQPAGLSFYTTRWPIDKPGVVVIEHGEHSFNIKQALSVTGNEDLENPDEGLFSFNVGAGLTAAKTVMHGDARDQMLVVLDDLVKLGWQRYISPIEPRLKDTYTLRYYHEYDNYLSSLPVGYPFSDEEWMALGDMNWQLHADGLFLIIELHRDASKMDPKEPGAYFLSFELNSTDAYGREHFEYEKMSVWRQHWDAYVEDSGRQRQTLEAELKKKGYVIDEHYQDPVIIHKDTAK